MLVARDGADAAYSDPVPRRSGTSNPRRRVGPGPGQERCPIDAVGLVMRRLAARRSLMVAAAVTTLVAVVAVAATALVLSAAGRGSVGAALDRSPVADRVVDVAGEIAATDIGDPAGAARLEQALGVADRQVRDLLGEALAPTLDGAAQSGLRGGGSGAGVVTRRVLSSSYVVPGPSPGARQRLAVVGGYEGLEEHAILVDGEWPGPVGPPGPDGPDDAIEVLVHEEAAAALDVGPGDEVRLTNTRDDSALVLRLTGTFRPRDAGSGYWVGDALAVSGVDRGSSFVTYGPFLAGPGAESVVADPTLTWRADPALAGLAPRQVDDLRRGVGRLLAEGGAVTAPAAAALAGGEDEQSGGASVGSSETLSVETDLDEVLAGVASPVAVARSAVGLALALVVLLGITAALLVTRLVQEDRRADVALRASRGFSSGQLRSAHALEAVVLVLPAVLLGPPLARLVVRAVAAATGDGAGATGIVAGVVLTPETWAVAGAAGLVVAALLSRRGAGADGRGRIAAAWSRMGLDLVVVPLAVVGVLQLLTYDVADLAAASDDALAGAGVDPVLVLTVPVVVLAAALVLGRVLRGVLLLGAGAAARSRGVVAALSAWQLARRSEEHRAMLVSSLLASAVVTVAVVQAATYASSQEAQARFAVGSDVRVSGLIDPARADEVVARVDELGGSAVVVLRERTVLGDLPVEVLAVKGAGDTAAQVLTPPLGEPGWGELVAPLTDDEQDSSRSGGARGDARPPPLPVVASEAVASQIGDGARARLRVAGVDVEVAVTGSVEGLPGVGPEADALGAGAGSGRAATGAGLLVDGAALERSVGAGVADGTETEVWATVPRDAVASLRTELEGRTQLEGRPDLEREDLTVADRWSATADRQDGPVGSGVRVALALAVLVGAVLGIVGFVAAAAVGLRRRRTEVAALRASGLSRSQVAGSLALERLGLLGVALLLGAVVGGAVAGVLAPRLVLTESATVPVPPPVAALDLGTVAAVAVVLIGLALTSTAALWGFVTRLVARPMSAELRAGEDT